MTGKKPIVKIRVYRGAELNYNAEAVVKNENHLVSLQHNTKSWVLFMKNLKLNGYCKVTVDSVWSEVKKGEYNEVKDIKAISKEVEDAFIGKDKIVLTPDQKKIADLEAKLEALINAKTPTNEDKEGVDKLRAEYKELYGKIAFNGWDAEKLKEKIEEKE